MNDSAITEAGVGATEHQAAPDHPSHATEREFLLRSIEDLQAEHAAGELTDRRHRELLDQYTARAAHVLRETATSAAAPATASPPAEGDRPALWRRWAIRGVLLATAVVAAWAVTGALTDRPPRGTVTGNAQSVAAADLETLAAQVEARPDDPAGRLAYARALMAGGQPVEALEQYDTATRLAPGDAEAHAYGGWLVFQAGLVDEALTRLDRAVDADPRYPDARLFRGIARREGGDRQGAIADLRTYLEVTPGDDPWRAQVEALLTELEGDTTTATS